LTEADNKFIKENLFSSDFPISGTAYSALVFTNRIPRFINNSLRIMNYAGTPLYSSPDVIENYKSDEAIESANQDAINRQRAKQQAYSEAIAYEAQKAKDAALNSLPCGVYNSNGSTSCAASSVTVPKPLPTVDMSKYSVDPIGAASYHVTYGSQGYQDVSYLMQRKSFGWPWRKKRNKIYIS